MAGADYRSCDKCGFKSFYDADLGYQGNHRNIVDLPGLGDWAVICRRCALTYECVVVHRKVAVVEVPCPEGVKYCGALHLKEI